jgi:hypothetical protein
MRTGAAATALLTALWVGSAGFSHVFAKPKAASPPDPSGCPRFEQKTDEKDHSIVFQLKNRCAKSIRCSIAWETACGRSEGTKHEEAADLDAGAAQHFTAQAQCSFEERWKISPAEWTCRFTGDDKSETAKR